MSSSSFLRIPHDIPQGYMFMAPLNALGAFGVFRTDLCSDDPDDSIDVPNSHWLVD